ncbi:MAG: 23S rRNA (adenine(2503)-C(2))-methyltransferase RlmN [Coriobacteriales bacterium]|jgi:23S rRNA (adenine2503-C2)-methyltransferase|nr:23S rRNA (adenine(2503)-C(2))-methyltransferase RlmN [Coriobacteriales bacterium]
MPAASGIKRYDIPGLQALLHSWGEPSFRATQLLQWLYAHGAQSYEEMSSLPASLRERLKADEPLAPLGLLKRQTSSDGTRKYLFGLADGSRIETVAIPHAKRLTVCFSTQVGCAMGCTFCSTGRSGLVRSLAPGEMVDQLIAVSRDLGQRVTNAVAMGEGEPFANYDATLAALRIMNSPDGLGIGARHLTVSTCGLLTPLGRFSHEPDQFTLAVSLHSAVQATRDALMPALAQQPLAALREALASYGERTRRRPSLEVTLVSQVNDTPAEVEALIGFARGMLCHVNLIPLNPPSPPLSEGIGPSSPPERCAAIASQLQAAGVECSIRRSRGMDIGGACGQLKGLAEAPA